jgi:hypothetical protein
MPTTARSPWSVHLSSVPPCHTSTMCSVM